MTEPEFASVERPITFGYGFRMRCDQCGQSSDLSGADYIRLNDEAAAHMICAHCNGSIHYGPLVADIRDPNDPALCDARINQLSWYHTSTYPTWPSTDYERDIRATLASGQARTMFSNPERFLEGQLTKALHLGTYEAAIENMYRRMADQGDGASTFYLHRVAVSIDPGRINPGYRAENDQPAAHITIHELDDLDLDAIRYVNVWEASGCISLAIRPETIVGIQTIHIPPPQKKPAQELDKLVAHLEARQAEPGEPTERQFRGYDLMRQLADVLVARYLPGVSPVVADHFTHAIAQTDQTGATDFRNRAELFARHATLLRQPNDIVWLFKGVPPRKHIGA